MGCVSYRDFFAKTVIIQRTTSYWSLATHSSSQEAVVYYKNQNRRTFWQDEKLSLFLVNALELSQLYPPSLRPIGWISDDPSFCFSTVQQIESSTE
jgi:hypothetical protein